MAVRIEFVNLIIPIQKINESMFEGGFDKFIKKYEFLIGKAVWFDKYIFRMGWMDPYMIDGQIEFWKENGLTPLEIREGIEFWKDLFAISTGVNQFISNCDWIEVDFNENIVWVKGTDSNDVYPNENFSSFNVQNDLYKLESLDINKKNENLILRFWRKFRGNIKQNK